MCCIILQLKPVRSLDDSIMDSYLAVRTTQASHIPFYSQSPTETLLNFPPSNPFASTLPSGPFDPFGFTSAQTTSVNPFLKANSFDLDCGNQRPVVKSTSLPIVLTASSSQVMRPYARDWVICFILLETPVKNAI